MNRYYPHTIIAQEGWSFIIGGLALSILFTCLCGWWSLPFWAFTLFCVHFFRDPARNIPEAPDAILCPADGRVVVVEKAIDPYRQSYALKISIFMNVFNVHSQRSPVTAMVDDVQYTKGRFVNASLDKSSAENERNAVLLTTRSGLPMTVVQVAGFVARRVLCYVNKGDSIMRGERYGFIRFGSRIDIYLPLDVAVNVAIGDKVRASETILAYLPAQDGQSHNTPYNSKNIAESRLKADVSAQNEQTAPVAQEPATVKAETTLHFQVNTPDQVAEDARLKAEQEAKAKAEAEAKLKAEQEAKAKAEAEAKLKAEQEAKAKAEAEAKLKAEQEAKAKAEAEAKLKAEQEAKAKAEAEAKLKAEQEAKAKAEAEAKLKAEQEAKAKAEAEAKLKAEQEAKAKAEAEAKLKAEQEAKAKAEAEAKLKAEQEAKAKAEAEAKLKAEQEAQAAAAKAKAKAEEVARAQAAAKAKAEEVAKLKAAQEAKAKAEAEAKTKAAMAAKAKAESEADNYRKAEEAALAEIAARQPIVRREVFAAVPEPWQTIEPSEVIIKTEISHKK